MACDDVMSIEKMKSSNQDFEFSTQVITGKVGGQAGGADLDTVTHARTGQVQTTLPKVLRDVGFKPGSGDFTTGFTVLPSQRDTAWFNPVDKNWYAYLGTIPSPSGHVVIAGTDPTIGGDWKPVTENILQPTVTESAKRSYAEAGYNLVDGSFQEGFTLASSSDVALDWVTGKAFSGAAGSYTGGTSTSGFADRSEVLSSASIISRPEIFFSTNPDRSASIVSALQAKKEVVLSEMYSVSTPVRIPNRKTLSGQGELTGISWAGGNATEEVVPSILEVKSSNPAETALANVTVRDFSISVNNAQGVKAVDMRYASVQSELDGIRISDLGANSIGFYIGKEWYARLRRCSVRTNSRVGTGVKVDTSVGQVNAVPLDVQINGANIGFDIDTSSNYVYGLDIPRTAHAENCNIGLKVRPGQGVRQGVISGYFENNVIDVEWGEAGSTASDRTQVIVWLGASFNPNNSRVILYEGRHYFYGCDRIDTLEVRENASVEIIGGTVENIINATGDSNRVRYRPSPTTALSTSKYGNGALLPGREMNYETITSSNSAAFDFVGTVFGSKPANGRACRVTACSRRTYESTVRFFQCIVSQNAAGAWGLTTVSGSSESSSSISIDSTTGAVTIGDTRSDSKVYLLSVSPF